LIEQAETGKKEVRSFGLLFAVLCALAGAYMAWRGKPAAWVVFTLSGLFLLTGLFLPRVLGPVYRAWMRFAALLAWFNTRLLLSLFFYLMLTPLGLLMRVFGKDLLHQRVDRTVGTYWIKRDVRGKSKQTYEHLF
jgi:hypothetical protein